MGGLAASELTGIGGVLVGRTDVVARDHAIPEVPVPVLRVWANEQAVLIAASKLTRDHKLGAAGIVMTCGGFPGKLPICTRGDDYLDADQLAELFSTKHEIVVFDGMQVDYDEDLDECHPKDFEHSFEADPDLIFVSTFKPVILSADRTWPDVASEEDHASPFWHLLRSIAEKQLGDDCYMETEERVAGQVGDFDIKRDVYVFPKPEYD